MKFDDLKSLYDRPFFDLISESHQVTRQHWPQNEIQLCTLLSIKTGNCSEDCSYCAQSARYDTDIDNERLMGADDVMQAAHAAKANGSTRFCMGAAWKGVKHGQKKFDQVLDIVRNVSQLGMEVCVTLGELGPQEAKALKEAGVTAYNHNIDTSPEHYPNIVTTHTFQDRLNTIEAVQSSQMSLCCGGILGLGESVEDRLRMLEVLSSFNPGPESVPINCLQPIPGTPMENSEPIEVFELVRMIAVARIALPESWVRLSAGRNALTDEGQALCFYAGANSIFYGDKLLTAKNPEKNRDLQLLKRLNLLPKEMPYSHESATAGFFGHACHDEEHNGAAANGTGQACAHNHEHEHAPATAAV